MFSSVLNLFYKKNFCAYLYVINIRYFVINGWPYTEYNRPYCGRHNENPHDFYFVSSEFLKCLQLSVVLLTQTCEKKFVADMSSRLDVTRRLKREKITFRSPQTNKLKSLHQSTGSAKVDHLSNITSPYKNYLLTYTQLRVYWNLKAKLRIK